MLQQRSTGFNVSGSESLRVVSQNLSTLGQLEAAARSDVGSQGRLSSVPVWDFGGRELKIGQWIDVKDTIDQWVGSGDAVGGRSDKRERPGGLCALQRVGEAVGRVDSDGLCSDSRVQDFHGAESLQHVLVSKPVSCIGRGPVL